MRSSTWPQSPGPVFDHEKCWSFSWISFHVKINGVILLFWYILKSFLVISSGLRGPSDQVAVCAACAAPAVAALPSESNVSNCESYDVFSSHSQKKRCAKDMKKTWIKLSTLNKIQWNNRVEWRFLSGWGSNFSDSRRSSRGTWKDRFASRRCSRLSSMDLEEMAAEETWPRTNLSN